MYSVSGHKAGLREPYGRSPCVVVRSWPSTPPASTGPSCHRWTQTNTENAETEPAGIDRGGMLCSGKTPDPRRMSAARRRRPEMIARPVAKWLAVPALMILIALASVVLLPGQPAHASPGVTARVSVDSAGNQGDSGASLPRSAPTAATSPSPRGPRIAAPVPPRTTPLSSPTPSARAVFTPAG